MTIVDSHMRESLEGHILEQVLDTRRFKAFKMKRPDSGRMMSTQIMFTPEGIVISGDLCPRPGTRGVVSDLGYGLDWFSGKLSENYLCEKFFVVGWHRALAEEELKVMIKAVKRGDYDSYGWTGELEEVSGERREQHDELVRTRKTLKDLMVSDEADREEQIKDTREEIDDLWKELRPLREKVVKLRSELGDKIDDLLYKTAGSNDLDVMGFYDGWREINEDAEDTPGWGYPPADGAWLCAIQQRFAELYAVMVPAEVA